MYVQFPLRRSWRRAVVVASVLLSAACCAAQSAGTRRDSVLRTPEVVALRRPAGLGAAVPVQRMDTADLRRRGIADMGDALRRLSGVNLRDYGGAGGLKTVSVRGLGAAHTAVCYDGMPVTDTRGGEIDLGRFSTDRLAALSLSVGDAPGLLVPVRTLAAATIDISSPASAAHAAPRGQAALRFGSFGMVSPSLGYVIPVGRRTVVAAAADFFYARNDYPFELRNGQHVTRERRKGSRMQDYAAELDMHHRTARGGTWTVKARGTDNHRRLPGQVVLYTEESDERLRESEAFVQTLWRQSFGRWSLMAGGKFDSRDSRYADIDAQYPGGAFRQHYRQRESYATAGAAYGTACLQAAYAVDYGHSALRGTTSADGRVRRDVVQQALSLRCRLSGVELTVRGILHNSTDRRAGGTSARSTARLTPSATVSWTALRWTDAGGRACEWRWRAFCKESFRIPTFTESYYYHLGSTDLRPERARQFGAGTTLFLHRPAGALTSLSFTADAYLNRISDRIQAVPRTLYVWQMVNVGRVRGMGADLTLDARFRIAPGHALFLAGNYSLQQVTDRTLRGGSSYARQLAYTPLHSGALSLAWENPWCGLAARVTAAGERWTTNTHQPKDTRLAPYAEFGLAAYRTFRLRAFSLEVRADLVNVSDAQYEIIRRYPMPGRSAKLSLTARW